MLALFQNMKFFVAVGNHKSCGEPSNQALELFAFKTCFCPERTKLLSQPECCVVLNKLKRNRTLDTTAIETTHSTRINLLSLLRIQRYMWRNRSLHYFPLSQAHDDFQRGIPATDTLGAICCSHNVASP